MAEYKFSQSAKKAGVDLAISIGAIAATAVGASLIDPVWVQQTFSPTLPPIAVLALVPLFQAAGKVLIDWGKRVKK